MIGTPLQPSNEPIAIVGMACRFPGAAGVESYWQLLVQGIDAITEVPPERWSLDAFYDPDPGESGKLITRWGGFVTQPIDRFDAAFFGMSPREAARLDPQQRLLLEVTWEALEDAAQVPARIAGSPTAVFVGCFAMESKVLQLSPASRELVDAHTATGSVMTMVANRLSHALDLRGPSVAVDTACSSSLVAVHLACQSLWTGESSMALAGGVNVMIRPEFTLAESKGGFLSPDGRCKAFDARANGYVRGEGAGMVVLKRLSDARRDGDPIHALIRGTAVNQDGHTNGITVPRGEAQQAVLREAYRRAGVVPETVHYVEAHGTGTAVGDPTELKALGAVLGAGREEGERCIVGSAKTNIGHLEAAAGVAGLIKATLCLEHRTIPPNLHFETPNPNIPFDDLRLRVPTACEPWPAGESPALAGVNSFGFGGTNAHVVLEGLSADERTPATGETPVSPETRLPAIAPAGSSWPYLLTLSGRSPGAVQDMAAAVSAAVARGDAGDLHDLCYTAGARRGHSDHRLAAVAGSPAELVAQLTAAVAGETRPGLSTGQAPRGQRPPLTFVFSGMGPQWWAMGHQLLQQEPVFRAAVERCDAALLPYTGWSLLERMTAPESASRMDETDTAQPANFALQVGLAALWRSWGIVPDAVVGHSAGEVAAAYVAGALSWEDAVRVIFHRSRLQQQTTGLGRLAAVGLPVEEAQRALQGYEGLVSVAAVNSPGAVTLAGEGSALEAVVEPLQARGVFVRFLRVKVPYHSHYMEPLRAELSQVLAGLAPQVAAVPLYSTVTGTRIAGPELDADYWWRNVREPVRFAATTGALIDDGYTTFLELSPHPVLAASIGECLAQRSRQGTVVTTLRRQEGERALLLGALGALYVGGYEPSWEGLYPTAGRIVPLPPYPWQRERHWIETASAQDDRLGRQDHPLLGRRAPGASPTWQLELNRRRLPYLDDHRLRQAALLPGAAYVEMGLAAARQSWGDGTYDLEGVDFKKALFLAAGGAQTVQTTLDPDSAQLRVYSRESGANGDAAGWTLHASATVRQRLAGRTPLPTTFDDVRQRCRRHIAGPACYVAFERLGFHYGPAFQGLSEVWKGQGETLGRIEVPDAVAAGAEAYQLHPAVLDAAFQLLLTLVDDAGETVYLPVGVDRVRVYRPAPTRLWAHARLVSQDATALAADLLLVDDAGQVLVEIEGFRARTLEAAPAARAEQVEDCLYTVAWQADAPAMPAAGGTESDPAADASPNGTWLVLADAGGVGETLASLLEEQGEHCLLAFADPSGTLAGTGTGSEIEGDTGTATPSEGRRRRWIAPTDGAALRRLVEDVAEAGRAPCRGVVHLWGLDAPAAGTATAEALMAAQEIGCGAALHLIRGLAEAGRPSGPRLWLVTRGAQPAGDVDQTDETAAPIAVAQAPLWGFGRVVAQEHRELWGGLIDLDPAAPAGEASRLFQALWRPDGEDQMAFRGGRRLVARLVRHSGASRGGPALALRPDASYLITGGLGDLGLEFARWLVQQGARRLVLLGRSPLPPRAEWPMVAADAPAARSIAAVRQLEAMGASIHLGAVDVADAAGLAAFLQRYRAEGWPPIRGVLHAAGVVKDGLLLSMDGPALTAVLRPKLAGAWLLHQLLQDEPLDFFVLFSSVASLLGTVGQANYAAGNAFMDALAHYRRGLGRPALSLNWGPWDEVGMAARLGLRQRHAQLGLNAIPPTLGVQALGVMLHQDAAQVGVLAMDWSRWRQSTAQGGLVPLLSALDGTSGEDASSPILPEAEAHLAQRLLMLDDPAARRELMEDTILGAVARVLGLERSQLDPRQPLNLLGVDSLMAVELKARLESGLGLSISVVDLLRGLSASDLADDAVAQLTVVDEDLARVLEEVEQLSLEEVQQLLG